MHSQHTQLSQADTIRERARRDYVEPAASRGLTTFSILTGDVVRALGLQSRVPAVCSALRSNAFLNQNGLTLESVEGPPSGFGTRVRYHYRRRSSATPLPDGLAELRGSWKGPGLLSEAIEAARGEFEAR